MRPTKSRGTKSHTEISAPRSTKSKNRGSKPGHGLGNQVIWGQHAAIAALENPKRTIHHVYASPKTAARLKIESLAAQKKAKLDILDPSELDRLLPDGTSHQGLAVSCAPLPQTFLDEITSPAKGLILVLDQITDPHNVGAMFRLAKAFNAKAVIMQSRHAPPLFGATAKVAVGTLETVPTVLVTNIANTLLSLQNAGWRVTGLAGEANISLEQAFQRSDAEVVVMGAEGPGLRPRVRDCCDQLAKIPMPGGAESLNVSTAAAIALYEAVRNLA
ncbi:MAG: 23S rRNA (guanosine(2251)-2'-O)-methyltransferase RlmB [Hyphomonadaceae bacterium]|nr:23S rRNA (guanosine(2251)-2'-O)-methyltransferase RlmB [Hyphomonadaceae bacterium]